MAEATSAIKNGFTGDRVQFCHLVVLASGHRPSSSRRLARKSAVPRAKRPPRSPRPTLSLLTSRRAASTVGCGEGARQTTPRHCMGGDAHATRAKPGPSARARPRLHGRAGGARDRRLLPGVRQRRVRRPALRPGAQDRQRIEARASHDPGHERPRRVRARPVGPGGDPGAGRRRGGPVHAGRGQAAGPAGQADREGRAVHGRGGLPGQAGGDRRPDLLRPGPAQARLAELEPTPPTS
jgi:hypothetical protein